MDDKSLENTITPSQQKAVDDIREQILAHYGEDYEFKRFEVYSFSSNKSIELFTEIGKITETPMESITNRIIRQIFIGERGGCELANPADPKNKGKIKGLQECIKSEV